MSRAWLLAETPVSRWQARLGHAYLRWLSFRENPLALAGLGEPRGGDRSWAARGL